MPICGIALTDRHQRCGLHEEDNRRRDIFDLLLCWKYHRSVLCPESVCWTSEVTETHRFASRPSDIPAEGRPEIRARRNHHHRLLGCLSD